MGTGDGKAFCAGGDVASKFPGMYESHSSAHSWFAAVIKNARRPETRPKSIDFFKRE